MSRADHPIGERVLPEHLMGSCFSIFLGFLRELSHEHVHAGGCPESPDEFRKCLLFVKADPEIIPPIVSRGLSTNFRELGSSHPEVHSLKSKACHPTYLRGCGAIAA